MSQHAAIVDGSTCHSFQNKVITFLDELSDDALKKEATSEAKSDTFSVIMKVYMHLASWFVISCFIFALPWLVYSSLTTPGLDIIRVWIVIALYSKPFLIRDQSESLEIITG